MHSTRAEPHAIAEPPLNLLNLCFQVGSDSQSLQVTIRISRFWRACKLVN